VGRHRRRSADYFDATFCTGGVRRALTVNENLVLDVVERQVSAFHSAQVIVNSSIYGGTGGAIGVSSYATRKDDGTPVVWEETPLRGDEVVLVPRRQPARLGGRFPRRRA
jgi:hypothetical protein